MMDAGLGGRKADGAEAEVEVEIEAGICAEFDARIDAEPVVEGFRGKGKDFVLSDDVVLVGFEVGFGAGSAIVAVEVGLGLGSSVNLLLSLL